MAFSKEVKSQTSGPDSGLSKPGWTVPVMCIGIGLNMTELLPATLQLEGAALYRTRLRTYTKGQVFSWSSKLKHEADHTREAPQVAGLNPRKGFFAVQQSLSAKERQA